MVFSAVWAPKHKLNPNEQTKKNCRLFQAEKEPALTRHKNKSTWHLTEKINCGRSIEYLGSTVRDEARKYISK